MKGKTTIELTDAETGAKEVIESENMVTNALSYYFANLGMINYTPFNDEVMRGPDSIFELLGGILLFDKPIAEDADNIHAPAGVRMTGNAAYGYTSNNEVLEFGSYNASESGWQADGSLKFVYDFTTSQANGDIACVCLTSLEHGYVGEGNSSGKYYTGSHDEFEHHGGAYDVIVDGSLINGTSKPRIVGIDALESTMTVISYRNLYYNSSYPDEFYGNTGKLKFMKYTLPLTKYDIRDNKDSHILLEEKEVDLPEEFINFVNANSPTYVRSNTIQLTDALYMVVEPKLDIVEAEADVHVLKINSDYTIEHYVVKNQTGERLRSICYGNGFVLSEKLVYLSYDSYKKAYYINIKNSADFGELSNVTGEDINYFNRSSMRNITREKTHGMQYIVDLVNKEILPRNCYRPNSRGSFSGNISGNPLVHIYDSSSASSGTYFTLYRSQNYLATINNLENKVTKTSDKTMKVTYTVTF